MKRGSEWRSAGVPARSCFSAGSRVVTKATEACLVQGFEAPAVVETRAARREART